MSGGVSDQIQQFHSIPGFYCVLGFSKDWNYFPEFEIDCNERIENFSYKNNKMMVYQTPVSRQ